MERIHNIYINSTSKAGNSKNYDYKLYFSSYNILVKPDEECFIYLKSFQTLNTFYNINDTSKSFYVIRQHNDTLAEEIFEFTLQTGNYNCFEFADVVNSLCKDHFTMTYDSKKNCYLYIQNPLLVDFIVFLQPSKNNAKYFGLYPEISNFMNGTEVAPIYGMIINLNYFSLIVIKIIGLITNNKTIDNFTSTSVCASDIFGIVNRQDAPINSLIYFNDINNSFMYRIQNNNLDYLNLIFTNEYNDLLTDLQDWLLVLQVVIKKVNNY
jgi:hypothetical protein